LGCSIAKKIWVDFYEISRYISAICTARSFGIIW